LSTNPKTPIAGIMYDTEVYSAKKEPEKKRNYPRYNSGYNATNIKLYSKEKKEQLSDKDLVKNSTLKKEYTAFLIKSLRAKFLNLKGNIHAINPHFLFGIYMHPDSKDWFRTTLSQSLSTEQSPILIFGIHSYGYKKDKSGQSWIYIPDNIEKQYAVQNIQARYIAGFLPRKFSEKELQLNLVNLPKKTNCFWLFKVHDYFIKGKQDGTLLSDSYKKVIKQATN